MAVSAPFGRGVLAQVVPASSMPVFAHERLLPVLPALTPLFTGPEGSSTTSPVGLVRGQTVVCAGTAAASCALGLAAAATQAGSWVAFVGLPTIGLLAASTIGVSLERTVFVDRPHGHSTADASGGGGRDTARSDVGAALAALVDGLDLVVVARRSVSTLPPSLVRRLQIRAQSKGSVLVIVGDTPSSVSVDLRLTARAVHWEGLGEGHGHLRRRLVSIEMDGRRCPRRRDHVVWLPDASGAMSAVDDVQAASACTRTDRDIESRDGVVVAIRRDIQLGDVQNREIASRITT